MGFYSWTCAISGESIANTYSEAPYDQSYVGLVLSDSSIVVGTYTGYGKLDTLLGPLDIEATVGEKVKLVLIKYWREQKYTDLAFSQLCKYQGYFYSVEEIDWSKDQRSNI